MPGTEFLAQGTSHHELINCPLLEEANALARGSLAVTPGLTRLAGEVERLHGQWQTVKPASTAIVDREYEPQLRTPLVVDSATASPDSAAQRIASRMLPRRAVE